MTVTTNESSATGASTTVADIVFAARPGGTVRPLSDGEASAMADSAAALSAVLDGDGDVYGITHGFGALVDFPGAGRGSDHGMSLIRHLASAQGAPLPAEVSRMTMWLRLNSLRTSYSAVGPDFWKTVAMLFDRGFTPAMPRFGTVSASGDLQPLAHAALAMVGQGQAWSRANDGTSSLVDAASALRDACSSPVQWPAREALAFVNGTSVGLATTLINHHEISLMVRAATALSARLVVLLGASTEAYDAGIGLARGQIGQQRIASEMRARVGEHSLRAPGRPLQESYSVRAAPQVLGAVLDQLDALERILVREASGCTDNPIVIGGKVLHGANFHSMPVALASDQLGLCLHQIVFLLERQLALICSPARNGGRPPMLTPVPGSGSGLAGVQISATSFVSSIRQRTYPTTLTSLPTNNDNQDHVPMTTNGAVALMEAVDIGWYVVGSAAVALTHLAAAPLPDCLPSHPDLLKSPDGNLWKELAAVSPPLNRDRPLADEVLASAHLMRSRMILYGGNSRE